MQKRLLISFIMISVLMIWQMVSITTAAPPLQVSPTAAACQSPTIQAVTGRVNVRGGPSTSYGVVGVIALEEVRPVTGRAEFAQWWQVELADGVLGWVSDGVVEATGRLGLVPIVSPPPFADGTLPALDEEAWIVPLDPSCQPTMTPTLFATVPPTLTPTPAPTREDGWSAPLNLSRSGNNAHPIMIVDESQRVHVIWQDTILHTYMYTQRNGQTWTSPVPVTLPFGVSSTTTNTPVSLFIPQFIVRGETIYAVWREGGDLYTSQVPATNFANFSSWTTPQLLAEGVVNMQLSADSNNGLHLAYMRNEHTAENPAGIYYRRSLNAGNSWEPSQLIYDSIYFRALPANQTNIQLITHLTENNTNVWLSWDNGPLAKLLLTSSLDGGQTWQAIREVDRRQQDDRDEAVTPSGIIMWHDATTINLFWRAGHGNSNCALYHQTSSDNGQTWQSSILVLEECADQQNFVGYYQDFAIIYATINGIPSLLAWNGAKWSNPQSQITLLGFDNPETFRFVEYQCQQNYLDADGRLLVVGCDQQQGQDIWMTTLTLNNLESWFALPSIWQPATDLVRESTSFNALKVVANDERLVHVFWLQGEYTPHLTYMRRDVDRWSSPVEVLTSPEDAIKNFAVTMNARGRILGVWSTYAGEIYFSQADAPQAHLLDEWSIPQLLPLPITDIGGMPDIVTDSAGNIHIVYNIPFNEKRGIYIISSSETGFDWGEPRMIFDGTEMGWEVVGNPQVTLTHDDYIHVGWTKQSFVAESEVNAIALYYTVSSDAGITFKDPELVTEAPLQWWQIVGVGQRGVHRLWQTRLNNQAVLEHQQSIDNGENWQSLISLPMTDGLVDLIQAPNHSLHLVQLTQETINYWQWNNTNWVIEEGAEFEEKVDFNDLSSLITNSQELIVMFSKTIDSTFENFRLVYLDRLVNLSTIISAPPTLTPTPFSSPQPTIPLLPSPTPTIALSNENGAGNTSFFSNQWTIVAFASVPVGLFVVLVGLRALVVSRR